MQGQNQSQKFNTPGELRIPEAVEKYGPELLRYLKKIEDREPGTGASFREFFSLPDGVYVLQFDVTAGKDHERVLAEPGDNSFNNNTYQEIARYTVPNDVKKAIIQEIAFDSDRFDIIEFQLTIKGRQVFTAANWHSAYTLPVKGSDGNGVILGPGEEVIVEAVSDGATTISGHAVISGTEVL